MVSKSHHWLHQLQLVTDHSLKGATNYGNRGTGVGTKHAVLRLQDRDLGLQVSRPRPDGHRVSRPRPGQNELECIRVSRPWSRDHNTVSLFGHVACLDPGVPAHDALRLMVDTYEGRKASSVRPPGSPRNVWLNKVQDANALILPTLWGSEVARGDEAERRSLRLHDDDDYLCQKWRVKLFFKAPTACPEPGLLNV